MGIGVHLSSVGGKLRNRAYSILYGAIPQGEQSTMLSGPSPLALNLSFFGLPCTNLPLVGLQPKGLRLHAWSLSA